MCIYRRGELKEKPTVVADYNHVGGGQARPMEMVAQDVLLAAGGCCSKLLYNLQATAGTKANVLPGVSP